jgi:hypothetical protein
VTGESLVVLYYSGQALVAPSGDVALVPYDAGKTITKAFPLKELQAALAKLKVRTVLLIIDPSVVKAGGDGKTKFKAPLWETGGPSITRLIGASGLGSGLEPEQLGHGLFTYYLLKGMRKDADRNGDGEVTLAELGAYLIDSVTEAARSDYGHEQKPQALPPIGLTGKTGSPILAKVISSPR